MKFCDLPIDTRQRLNCERLNLHNRSINSAYEVLLYNQLGTRYFHARRHQNSWYDDKGNYMPFGGGSEWTLQYGCIGFSRKKQVMGYDYVSVSYTNLTLPTTDICDMSCVAGA